MAISVKNWIEEHFNAALLICAFLGLVLPELSHIPDFLPIVFLAIVMTFSCSSISVAELKRINVKDAFG